MIKIIPKNDNFEPFLSPILEINEKTITTNHIFIQEKFFTVVIEKENKIIFFETEIETNEDNCTLKILTQNEIFKRNYDRLPIKYQIKGDIEGETLDISAGGMSFLTNEKPPKNQNICLNLAINEQKIDIEFRILRLQQNPTNKDQTIISGQFNNLSPKNKSIILQECLKFKLEQKGGSNE